MSFLWWCTTRLVYRARVDLGLRVSGSLEDEEGGAAQRSQSQRARVGTREKGLEGSQGGRDETLGA
jgi:hypothetical protein